MKRIAIFYITLGGGHLSIAQGLKERLNNYFGNKVKVDLIDPTTSFTNPLYSLGTSISCDAYNLYYKISQKGPVNKLISQFYYLLHQDSFKEVIRSLKPDIIISTAYLFDSQVKNILDSYGKKVPWITFIADPFNPNPSSFNHDVDLFLTYDRKFMPNLNNGKINPKKVLSVGFPLRQDFYKKYARHKVLQNIGLKPTIFTILFGGSGYGMDHLERIAKSVSEMKNIQALFICGKNKLLKHSLDFIWGNNKNIKIFDSLKADKLASLMQSADLFVGKAGPNAMFETIISQLPMIVTPPVLGQEIGNRSFIEKNNIGFLSTNSTQTMSLIKKISQNPELLNGCRKNLIKVKTEILKMDQIGFPKFIKWVEKQEI